MKITALCPWYGANRMLAENVGRLLAGCEWVGVPFAGGMCELRHLTARTVLVSDLHRHVINLAQCVANGALNAKLVALLSDTPFHPDVLSSCQERLWAVEADGIGDRSPVYWAADYFVCAWMSRNGKAGTADEFDAGLSVRWEAGGGDSAVRYRNAVESLREWQKVLARCTFVCLDVFDFLAKVKDRAGHGLYLDPPFPGPGDRYKHKFGDEQHRRLAASLDNFGEARVVCRFYDHELIRSLYPEGEWTWHRLEGRKQTNAAAPEVLLVRNGGAV